MVRPQISPLAPERFILSLEAQGFGRCSIDVHAHMADVVLEIYLNIWGWATVPPLSARLHVAMEP